MSTTWKARYRTLDDRTTLDAALNDPDGFISGTPTPLIIDEIQRAPELLRAIKLLVDRDRKPGQYLLTGSANVLTLSTVSESLAGRVAVFTLHPFCWGEISESVQPTILKDMFSVSGAEELMRLLPEPIPSRDRGEIVRTVLKGGYPVPALMDSQSARHTWFSAYRQTYLERDLLQVKSIEHLPDFNRLLSLAASRTGGLLNLSDLSRESRLPFSTLRRYVNLLEVTYQVSLIHPYFTNAVKRLVKTPKLYFNDTGMALYLRGVDDWATLEHQGQEGAIVETWVASELLKLMATTDRRLRLYFWRTQTGQEVDFIIERGDRITAVEVKWSQRILNADLRNIERLFEQTGERMKVAIILYSGTETVAFSRRIIAVPLPRFFASPLSAA